MTKILECYEAKQKCYQHTTTGTTTVLQSMHSTFIDTLKKLMNAHRFLSVYLILSYLISEGIDKGSENLIWCPQMRDVTLK